MSKKLYIGYDLGDGETITDNALADSEKNFNIIDYPSMTMPSSVDPGKALPTVYGYDNNGNVVFSNVILVTYKNIKDISINFKRKPMDLLGTLGYEKVGAIIQLFDNDGKEWPTDSIVNTPQIREYRKKVIVFTDAIFSDAVFAEKIRSSAQNGGAGEIVVTVGHPTKWSKVDALIYKRILQGSILGKKTYAGYPVSIVLAQESRAAFLYERQINGLKIKKDTCAMLIDVGSSTIDITALTSDSRNSQYNSGNNYLGARAIDWLIFIWYQKTLFEINAEYRVDFEDIIVNNPTSEMSLLLNCRKAKENVFSTGVLSTIIFADFPVIRLEPQVLDELVGSRPVKPVLKRYTDLPDEVAVEMGDKSWKELFREFLEQEKSNLAKNKTVISRIIFTGSASRMPVVKAVTKEVFVGIETAEDMDPARTISKGLVAVGASNDKSIAFQKDISHIIQNRIPELIIQDIPDLVGDMEEKTGIGPVIADLVQEIVFTEMDKWRKGKYKTIDDATDAIKAECTEENLSSRLKNDSRYMEAVGDWYTNKLSKDIALELQELCQKYNVKKEFELKDLNISGVKVDMGSINGGKMVDLGMMDVLGGVIGLIAGIIAYIALPTVIGIILLLVSMLSATLGGILFLILAAIPVGGYAIIAVVAGYALYVLVTNGVDSVKEKFSQKITGYDLPSWVRERVTDSKIKESFNSEELLSKLKEAMTGKENSKKLVDGLITTLNAQVSAKADEIKYTIESM
ncbi:MAG TPA: hypothetical protein GXX75_22865 [Clostridiales bacterium]|nr:hypothetical protein [Clostridiales bacterium]